MVILNNGEKGAVTFIGTVSPAGGNLKEPVTESTRKPRAATVWNKTARTRSATPPSTPIESYSKYLEYPEIIAYLTVKWDRAGEKVAKSKTAPQRPRSYEQINILGDDGVPVNYHVDFWKSELIDFTFLQQDAFDPVDAVCSMERQKYMLNLLLDICDRDLEFDDFEKCRDWFKELINDLRQMNYVEFHSDAFKQYEAKLSKLLEQHDK